MIYEPIFPLDDAYITLHNARILLTGVDNAYHGSALVGASSQVHLLLVALLGLILPLPPASVIVGGVSAGLYAIGLWRLAKLVTSSPWLAFAAVLIGLGFADAPVQLVNGLETGLAMAAVVWSFVLAIERSRTALPILCGLLPFIRPELAVLAILLIVYRAWLEPKWLLRDLALAAAAAAPFALWLQMSTGSPIPLTAGAKTAFFAESNQPLEERFKEVIFSTGLSIVGALILLASMLPVRAPFGLVARFFILCIFIAMLATIPSAASHNHSRYLFPMLPAALLLILAATREGRFAKLVIPILLALNLVTASKTWAHIQQEYALTRNEYASVAQWAKMHLQPNARILVHDAGYMAWTTDFFLIDVVGLKTPSSIEEHLRWTLPSSGRDRYLAIGAIAERHQPTHLIAHNWGFWSNVATGLRQAGWRLRPIRVPEGFGYTIYELSHDP